MTLRRKLREVFFDHELQNFPIARAIDDVLAHTASLTRQYIILAACSGVLVGFGLCMLWYGANVSSIQDTLAKWRTQYVKDYENHHNMKPLTKAAAQVAVQKIEDAKEKHGNRDKESNN